MNFKQAKELSFLVPWKVDECFSGPQCWCRRIVPVDPIPYNDEYENFGKTLVSTETEDYEIIPDAAIDQTTAEYIVKLHNEHLDRTVKSLKKDIGDFKKKLSEIVDERFIDSWLQKPNVSFDNRKPIDLINEDNYDPLYEMIYRIGSGEPST